MKNPRVFSRFSIALGVWALVSCGDGRDMAEVSYHFDLSSRQALEFKSDLRYFALQNGYVFVDGSERTKEARDYINKETERSPQGGAGLTSQSIIDVTVEPESPRLDFLIFAKTSAYDAEKVSLTMIYNKNSADERVMVDNFSQSQFLRNWKQ